MLKKYTIYFSLIAALGLTACATNDSVGSMGIGSDSAAIKSGRNTQEAQLSRAELDQHRRQRTNVHEELDLERDKRRNRREAASDNMGVVREGAATAGGVGVTVKLLKSLF